MKVSRFDRAYIYCSILNDFIMSNILEILDKNNGPAHIDS